MNLAQVRTLFAYDTWANDALFDAVSTLTDEQLRRDFGTSHRSIFGSLVHIVAAEEVWLSRWKGRPKNALAASEDFSSLAQLREFWSQVRNERDALIDTFTDGKLQESMTVTTTAGQEYHHRFWEMFQHLANHSTYHRGQIASMLRQLGVAPPATDLIKFYRERTSSVA